MIKPIKRRGDKLSLKTKIPVRSCSVGETYCKIPTSDRGIYFAPFAKRSRGIVVAAPEKIRIKSGR